ncbi:MAG: cryptochrome/photolyase family protein [Alphaproteobacteria bacterium]|nr:cryptochrome/photolyase family protein [Alphaproteobacteria bacterium]
MTTLRLILGDQLDHEMASLRDVDAARDVVMLCEVAAETGYVKHHKKKIAFLFSAMRHFAAELAGRGLNVRYTRLDDAGNVGSFTGEVARAVKETGATRIVTVFPGEYRVLGEMKGWAAALGVPVDIREDDRFLTTPAAFAGWAHGRKSLRMEFFYREMRRQYNVLMNGHEPEGGEWNYDAENRKFPPDGGLFIPRPSWTEPDEVTREVMALVAARFDDHFGDVEPFYFAVTRAQALEVLEKFITERLPLFGDYQDAMVQGQPWMYHSHISFYLNCGLLRPLEVVQAAEAAYRAGKAPLNAAEGFIRQVMGWREYVRGVYWLRMPEYVEENFLQAKRKLPWFYWDTQTDMNCLRQCVIETRQNAYAHHIQRLMVLGNFALLAGIDPAQVNEWYLIVYADAYEWVELPNVSGMILFADGGYLASKPYAAGGAYIDKMSDYCKNCSYNVKEKTGATACPFNYLYWDFMIRNREKLGNNPRLGMTYRTLDAMEATKIGDIQESSRNFLKDL